MQQKNKMNYSSVIYVADHLTVNNFQKGYHIILGKNLINAINVTMFFCEYSSYMTF